jgi:hypothetical protein
MAYQGVVYDPDISNEVAVRYGLANGEVINVGGGRDGCWPGSELEIHISVHKGGRYLAENTWYVTESYINSYDDLRNSETRAMSSQEDALNLAVSKVVSRA